MCLILEKDPVKIITDTDIVVYKVVRKLTRTTKQSLFGFIQSETFYRSPYYLFDYEKGVTYYEQLELLQSPHFCNKLIGRGFHSYERLEDAKYNIHPCDTVVKCVIPAGSELYKGCGIDLTSQYASNKIIIKEEV